MICVIFLISLTNINKLPDIRPSFLQHLYKVVPFSRMHKQDIKLKLLLGECVLLFDLVSVSTIEVFFS